MYQKIDQCRQLEEKYMRYKEQNYKLRNVLDERNSEVTELKNLVTHLDEQLRRESALTLQQDLIIEEMEQQSIADSIVTDSQPSKLL